MQRHRHQELIRFLNQVEHQVPVGKVIHVILDNYCTHKHSKGLNWLARHPRWTFHFIPTSSSWLNVVDGFFARLAKRKLNRGVFRSLVELQTEINNFFIHHIANEAKPFRSTPAPDAITSAVKRGHQALDSDH